MSTSRIAAAHPYIGVAWSSALKLGLHSRSVESISPTQDQLQERKRTVITILKLDLYASLVLGLPSLVSLHNFDYNLLIFEGDATAQLHDGERNHQDAIRLELSLKHLEILKITGLGLEAVCSELNEAVSGELVCPLNVNCLEVTGGQLQAWARSSSALLRRIGNGAEWEL